MSNRLKKTTDLPLEPKDVKISWAPPRVQTIVRLRKKMEKIVDTFAVYEIPKEDLADFVLCYSSYELNETLRQVEIDDYLGNLKEIGLSVKRVPSIVYPHLVFVLITGSKSLLKRYANIYGLLLSYDNPYYKRPTYGLRWFACRVHSIEADDPEYSRAPDTFSGERPRDITYGERIMVLFQILRVTKYGPRPTQHGILRLLEKGVFTDAYPLHDMTDKWTEEGILSDRQILAKYWANSRCFFKYQPLNLIVKYFGAEVAFYFAFLSHLVMILFIASVVGLSSFLYGLMTMTTPENTRSYDICESNITICPACANLDICKYGQLRLSCSHAFANYVLDNQATICYAVLISLWTTVAMELWKRKQASLAYEWNVFSAHIDVSMRPEYALSARLKRISPVTGELEPYEDVRVRATHLFISYSVVTLLAVLAISVVIAVRFYMSAMRAMLGTSKKSYLRKYATVIAPASASTISVVIMLTLESIYVKLAMVMTNLENARTEVEYDNSLIYKRFVLTFINGYAVTFYVAFFQGRFYSYPGKQHHYETHIQYELCDNSGCSVNLAIHLVIVLMIKSLLMNLVQLIKPIIVTWIKKTKKVKALEQAENLPVWERQYHSPALNRFFLVDEYQEIALQYGYVAFFSTAFTLAPVFALMHALISVRVDSRKFIGVFRRPVPVRVSGLMAWEGIFKIITLVGVVINAFIVGFTIDFIPRQIYFYSRNKSGIYIETMFSLFDTNDFPNNQNQSHPPFCHYKGKRYPPSHPSKYTLSKDHWFELAIRIAFVIIYEQVVFMMTSILAYAIPDVPRSIKEKMEFEKTKSLKKNLATF